MKLILLMTCTFTWHASDNTLLMLFGQSNALLQVFQQSFPCSNILEQIWTTPADILHLNVSLHL